MSPKGFPADRVRGVSMAKVPKRWYEDFFGPDYLVRYVHPETDAQVDRIVESLQGRPGTAFAKYWA